MTTKCETCVDQPSCGYHDHLNNPGRPRPIPTDRPTTECLEYFVDVAGKIIPNCAGGPMLDAWETVRWFATELLRERAEAIA